MLSNLKVSTCQPYFFIDALLVFEWPNEKYCTLEVAFLVAKVSRICLESVHIL